MLSKDTNKIFDIAVGMRKFEIGLFWQRSLFFWGFVAAAFVAYAALSKEPDHDQVLPLVIAGFGYVCSFAWTLGNRGSKYWHRAWEERVERVELDVLRGKLFTDTYNPRSEEIHWWGVWDLERHYSVSKLAIALSDFTVAIWFLLMVRSLMKVDWSQAIDAALIVTIFLISVGYSGAMLWWAQSKNSSK